jgi:hypothetical protein
MCAKATGQNSDLITVSVRTDSQRYDYWLANLVSAIDVVYMIVNKKAMI